MTEKEKRDRGLLYDPAVLMPELLRCKDLCFDYNQLRPSDLEGQRALIRRLLGQTGQSFHIQAPFWCDYGYNIRIGESFYANHNCVMLDAAPITFGDHVFIGPDCGFYTAGHPLNAEERAQGLEYARPIVVGDHVWFGGGVRVMPGVTIGSHVVIGAGAVVNRDIPDHTMAGGVPAASIRRI